MNTIKVIIYAAFFAASVSPALAQYVDITALNSDSTFTLNGETFSISWNADTTAILQDEFARTSCAYPPDCLQPIIAADWVAAFSELEILTFLVDRVTKGTGPLLDARAPADVAVDHIPSAVNVPVSTLVPDNRYRVYNLRALVAKAKADGTLDFTDAFALTFYSSGVWSNDAKTAIGHPLSVGYAADDIFYYRSVIQAWLLVELTAITPQIPG